VYIEVASDLAGRKQEELRWNLSHTTTTVVASKNAGSKKDVPKLVQI
jgi:hypothetical protein